MKATSHHLRSLDTFRGLTIAAMILVNNPGDWNAVFPQLQHASWNGCTLADMVFPWFIFIMGVAMPFALTRRRQSASGVSALYARVARRTFLLIALGLALNAISVLPHLSEIRFPGVLQRIAVVYAVAALLVLRYDDTARAAWAAFLIVAEWLLLTLVPFGGHAAGTIQPGANVAAHVDRLVFGRHMLAPIGDPEGLLSTLPAIATALIGSLVGSRLRTHGAVAGRVAILFGAGALMAVGGAWAATIGLPLNKFLWTGSYTFLTAGVATMLLVSLYVTVDVWRVSGWTGPFVWMGANPLPMYFLSELVGHLLDRPIRVHGEYATARAWIFWSGVMPRLGGHAEVALSFAIACATVLVWIAVAGTLYARNVRLQV
jgi:predicted acyltransferase